MVYRLDSKTFASSKECDTPILVLGSEISLHMRINITHDLYTFYPHFEDHFFVFKEGSKYLLFVVCLYEGCTSSNFSQAAHG